MAYDLILVGGGLANGLIAFRLSQTWPDLRLAIVEKGDRLGGNHTWSFHGSDLLPSQRDWVQPLISYSWPRHEVRFGASPRILNSSYHSIASDQLASTIEACPTIHVVTKKTVAKVSPTAVTMDDGEELTAPAVIDGRGAMDTKTIKLGFQKFLGLEVRVAEPHGLQHPILMDGRVDQIDGFRFVYVLPFAPDRLLIEDTYYSDASDLSIDTLRNRIEHYAADAGWKIAEIERQEHGVLPITLAGDIDAFWREGPVDVPRAGMRAALFHATTGYSVPAAVRLADAVATVPVIASDPLVKLTRSISCNLWRQHRFYRLLNRMLYLAAEPQQRIKVMARFYRLPAPLIARFYAGHTTAADKIRILAGKPPVKVRRAIGVLSPRAVDRVRP